MTITSAIRGGGEWVFSFGRHYYTLLIFGEDSIELGPVRQDLQGLKSWLWGLSLRIRMFDPAKTQFHQKKNG